MSVFTFGKLPCTCLIYSATSVLTQPSIQIAQCCLLYWASLTGWEKSKARQLVKPKYTSVLSKGDAVHRMQGFSGLRFQMGKTASHLLSRCLTYIHLTYFLFYLLVILHVSDTVNVPRAGFMLGETKRKVKTQSFCSVTEKGTCEVSDCPK